MHASLPLRILVVSMLLLVAPLCVMAFLEFQYGFHDALEDAKKQLLTEANSKEIQVTEFSHTRTHLLAELAYLINIEKILPSLPSDQTNFLLHKLASVGALWEMDIFKITPEGRFVKAASSNPLEIGLDLTEVFEEQNILQKHYVSFLLYDSSKPEEKILTAAQLVTSEKDNQPLAVLMISYPLNAWLKGLLVPKKAPFLVNFALLNLDKIIFAASDPEMDRNYFIPFANDSQRQLASSKIFGGLPLPPEPLSSRSLPETKGYFEFWFKGERQIAYLLHIPSLQRYLLAFTAMSNAYAAPRLRFFLFYGVYLSIFLIGAILVSLLTLRMAKPFNQLSRVMNEVKSQNLNARYRSDPIGFEINYLGEIFNEMIDSLLKQVQKTEEEHLQREKLEQELKIGHEVQMQLLPQTMPQFPGIEIAEIFIPAKEVGGDFYDVFVNETTNQLILAIADTSGKGISACLYSLGVRSLIRGFGKVMPTLEQITALTNTIFYDEAGDSGMFVTLFIGAYDAHSHLFRYYSCGHNPPLLRRKNGTVEILSIHGIALGLKKSFSQQEESIVLAPGDILVLYTDGVTESHNANKELFGIKRLTTFLNKKTWGSAEELIQDLLIEIKAFTGLSPQHDDITLLAMKVMDI